MLAAGVLERDPDIDEAELREALSSNLCRCTGYQNIIKSVRAAAEADAHCRDASEPISANRPAPRGPAAADRSGRSSPTSRSRTSSHAGRALAGRVRPTASVDSTPRARIAGVVAVWTARRCRRSPADRFPPDADPGARAVSPTVLARAHVRYVGEPVAAVFAADPYLAEDAADARPAAIEPLTPFSTPPADPFPIRGNGAGH